MSQKVVNRTNGLVDYKELETNVYTRRKTVDRKGGSINTIYKKAAGGESRR